MESPHHIPPGLLCSGGERGGGRKNEEGGKGGRGKGGGEERRGGRGENREGGGRGRKGRKLERNILSREKLRKWGWGRGVEVLQDRECKDTQCKMPT